jgi:hypothetical protein
VRHDVSRLEEVSKLLDAYGLFDLGLDFGPKVTPRNHPYEPDYANTYSVERRFQPLDPETTYRPERRYGWVTSGDIRASEAMRIPYTSLEGDNLDDLALPSEVLYRDFLKGTAASRLRLDLPDGEYRVTSIVANQPELATGAFQIRAGAGALRYAVAETGDKSLDVRVEGGRLELEFAPEAGKSWLVSGLVVARRAPRIAHVPVRSASAGAPLHLRATITAPDGVAEAALQYWPPGETRPRVLALTADGRRWSAELTPEKKWDGSELRYALLARDRRGAVTRLPARGEFTMLVGRDSDPPEVRHTSPASCEPGTGLRLAFEVRDASRLALVRLHYRHLTQSETYRTVDLTPAGADSYEATIPGDYIGTRYDLIYYLEAVDRFGNGAFYPDPDRTAPYVVVRVRR